VLAFLFQLQSQDTPALAQGKTALIILGNDATYELLLGRIPVCCHVYSDTKTIQDLLKKLIKFFIIIIKINF